MSMYKSILQFIRQHGSPCGWPGKFVRLVRLLAGRGRERLVLRRLARRLNRKSLDERLKAGAVCRLRQDDGAIINFVTNQYDGYIKTEETIHWLLFRDRGLLPEDYELMPCPLGHWINAIGLQRTDKLLGQLKSSRRRILLCQHLFVRRLHFKPDDVIFTPHAWEGDDFYAIPHYAVNVDRSLIAENRSRKFSFIGSTGTHWIRKKLVELYPECCFDSGAAWGLNSDLGGDFRRRYIQTLGDADFSLCPRGTGISSVRIFESMAMDSIPVIIADGYKKPLADTLNWDDFSITVKESDIHHIENLLNSISETEMTRLKTNCQRIYQNWFSNDKLHKTVLKELVPN